MESSNSGRIGSKETEHWNPLHVPNRDPFGLHFRIFSFIETSESWIIQIGLSALCTGNFPFQDLGDYHPVSNISSEVTKTKYLDFASITLKKSLRLDRGLSHFQLCRHFSIATEELLKLLCSYTYHAEDKWVELPSRKLTFIVNGLINACYTASAYTECGSSVHVQREPTLHTTSVSGPGVHTNARC